MMRTPSFWYRREASLIAWLLLPLALLIAGAGWLRNRLVSPHKAQCPVICIGNITTGGTGKTPLVATLVNAAIERGWTPVILTRGYGGSLKGPVLITPELSPKLSPKLTPAQTGDEALMLSRIAPVVVAANRAEGAALIENEGLGDLIIMDDGMQNPGLHKNTVIACFNGRLGIGNGMLQPAGPLRESLAGIARAEAVIITGRDETGLANRIAQRYPQTRIIHAERALNPHDVAAVGTGNVIAIAGIGDPEGFFTMIENAGFEHVEKIAFADHEMISDDRLDRIRQQAQSAGATIITTEKDAARLDGRIADIMTIRLDTTLPADFSGSVIPPLHPPLSRAQD
ncbi:MAG TPA: tetraacyldisaccharide 4'-kinase [Alphaproteobacteria bacterium]|jgi:tetraacyldisaccharide 4'-kinase|nr:tetraacyldisaccharide 4'-kinase [SAR116 cluster bacterium]OUW36637.1 MAG: tetraacyldisaccharide 4'-kinase [Gammaproteobacteria bacterium TMED183]HCD49522.1 tetraacyldisaccharide 4'-kinase [Alphaproteobacteria bacterium]HCV63564.1 tetraacyldisaccharide 4'-kinase [Alphaproteobacteria bacterium]|tara:strand:+ start:1614 stop:2639 length:1026 start_codon:yes stop_codon:yes gene_type:complete